MRSLLISARSRARRSYRQPLSGPFVQSCAGVGGQVCFSSSCHHRQLKISVQRPRTKWGVWAFDSTSGTTGPRDQCPTTQIRVQICGRVLELGLSCGLDTWLGTVMDELTVDVVCRGPRAGSLCVRLLCGCSSCVSSVPRAQLTPTPRSRTASLPSLPRHQRSASTFGRRAQLADSHFIFTVQERGTRPRIQVQHRPQIRT